jgi:hypothetical protein
MNDNHAEKSMPSEKWTGSIVRVGDGRGFVVETESGHFVITAGHCLPHLPPCISFSGTGERTYRRLLGRIGEEPTISAECVFVDPVADLAVLESPDRDEFSDEAKAYHALTEATLPLRIGKLSFTRAPGPAWAESEAWLLSLDCRWFSCEVKSFGRCLWFKDAAEPIRDGMSGSPIVAPNGAAIGVLVTSVGDQHREGGPNPLLIDNLSGWLLRETARALRRYNRF